MGNAKVGVTIGLTVTAKVAVVAQVPAVAVNVYVPVAVVLTTDGLHVPVMLLVEVAGNVGTLALIHIDCEVPKLNVGVMFGFTVTVNITGVAHTAPFGVNV